MAIEIINYEEEYETEVLQLFYKSVFYNRKEFEYTRLPTWAHRYNIEKRTIRKLAIDHNKVIGSLGVLIYDGCIENEKYDLGFFVDNCILPEYGSQSEEILYQLFTNVENQARQEKVRCILGWDYTHKADTHSNLFHQLKYQRIDGINWIGGGTKHTHAFFDKNKKLGMQWKVGFSLLNLKFHFKEIRLKTPENLIFRSLQSNDFKKAVDVLNKNNKNFLFYPGYTITSLKEHIKKYHAKGIVAEINGAMVGILLYFHAPWSGWMFGKPTYTQSSTMFLIRHPLEFAVQPDFAQQVAPHLLLQAMKHENTKQKYLMFVDVFDTRIDWMKNAYYSIGATELPYDYGTILYKTLDDSTINTSRPFYIPTQLVISPFTTKDY